MTQALKSIDTKSLKTKWHS